VLPKESEGHARSKFLNQSIEELEFRTVKRFRFLIRSKLLDYCDADRHGENGAG